MLQRTCLVITAMLATLFSAPDTRADELLRVNVFPGPQHVALYVAKEKGLFAKRGLNVEITFTPNAKAQRDGLADGSIDIAQAAVDNAVAMVEVGKKDVIIVAGGGNGMLNLFVRPEIKSYDDIRGKVVVVDSPDTAYAFVLYKMLALKGLKKADYGVFQGGDCMRRFNGIRNDPNNVAVLLNFPCNVLADREGYPNWGSAAEALGAYQADGIWVMREWAHAHGDTLVKYIEAITLRMVDPSVPFHSVWASRGKVTRAEPISALYEQGRVRHVGAFARLEDQMCAFTVDFNRSEMGYSPDRVDALVWALTELMIEGEERRLLMA